MKVKRRGFLKAAMGGFVGACLPLPACLRAKPPLTQTFKPGIWAGVTEDDFAFKEVEAHSIILRTTISKKDIERAMEPGAYAKAMRAELERLHKDRKRLLKALRTGTL